MSTYVELELKPGQEWFLVKQEIPVYTDNVGG